VNPINIVFQYLYEFLDALITKQTSPEEAYRKFDEIAAKHSEILRKLTKEVQEARQNRDDEAVKRAVVQYEEALDRLVITFIILSLILVRNHVFSHKKQFFNS